MHRTAKWALIVIVVLLLLGVSGVFADMRGIMKKRALPHNYGNVIINNFSD
jgi:membrane-associated PAP2 superfamily phosphatase